jgi:signal transduction histidine kinase
MNLMLNGVEAMKETGGVLTVKTERGEGDRVLISISDTGVGLPAGRADEIFNTFFMVPQFLVLGTMMRYSLERESYRRWIHSILLRSLKVILPGLRSSIRRR